jgi:DNA-binding transcriptional LysR family regulator
MGKSDHYDPAPAASMAEARLLRAECGSKMDELTRIRTFMRVVQAGSFSAAARNLSSVSSVARQVKALEDEFGTRLLNRNTRRLSLTEAGRHLYERSTTLVAGLDGVKSELKALHEDVKGTLRVSLRVSVGTTVVVPALPRLLQQYPDLALDIVLTDERKDLIASSIDVAVWMGALPDSELVAKRLSPTRRLLCASPRYLAKRGVPYEPRDLALHECLRYTAPSYGNRWGFAKGDAYEEVEVAGCVRADNGSILLSCALADLGIIVGQEWMVRSHLEDGSLVRVLQDYSVNPYPGHGELYAVYPSSRGLTRKVRVFVDFLTDLFASDDAKESIRSLRPTQMSFPPKPSG